MLATKPSDLELAGWIAALCFAVIAGDVVIGKLRRMIYGGKP